MSSDNRRRRSFHRMGDDFDSAPGLEVPKLTDTARRRMSVSVQDIGHSGHFLVPLENLEVSTGYFEYTEGARRPVLRFSGWQPKVSRDGTLSYGSTGTEHRRMLERAYEVAQLLAMPAAERETYTSKPTQALKSEGEELARRIAQIERTQGRELREEELAIFKLLLLDLSGELPGGLTAQRAEQVLGGLRAKGWVTTDDYVVWVARKGCLWYKNALIGRRYCLHCLHETQGNKSREIETKHPRQTCPKCGRENPYIGQSLPRSFNYYSQEERLDTAHVTRAYRDSPLARLADEHKHSLLVASEVFDLRLPRDVYAERAMAHGNPIDPKGVEQVISRWAGGWVPFACKSPVTGMVTNVFVDEAGTALNIEIGAVTVQFEPYWVPSVTAGAWINAGDEIVVPAVRPVFTQASDYQALPQDMKRYLWTHVGEASWLMVEPEPVAGTVLDRRRASRVSGRYRTLYPVVLLRTEHVGRVYVDTRDCRIGKTYAVDAGVLRQMHVGGVKLNLDALVGSCYDFFHCEQRWNEVRSQELKRGKRRPSRSAKLRPAVPDMGAVTLPETGDGLSDDAEIVVLDPNSFVSPGAPSTSMEVLSDTDIGRPEEGADTVGTAAGSGGYRVAHRPEAPTGAGSDRASPGSPVNGRESEGSGSTAYPAGHADGEAVLGTDLEEGSPAESGGGLGNGELGRVPASAHQGV